MATILEGLSPEYISLLKAKILNGADRTGNCWTWTRGTDSAGYGCSWIVKLAIGSHRLSYALFKGDFDKSLHVLHNCDNPPCVNPDHLFLGTNLDNQNDRAIKMRGARKLSKDDVARIFLMNKNLMSQYEIADELGVCQMTVCAVLNGKTYKNYQYGKKRCNRVGNRNGASTLTDEQVVVIKKMLSDGIKSPTIAKEYGVNKTTIYSIQHGKTWRHL